MKTLCVCIDDYGLHEGINDAAIELTAMGRVHAVGCMTAGPAWRAQATRLHAAKAQGVDIGLHLDFTENFSSQWRMSLGEFIRKAYLGQHDPAQLRSEITRQLDTFEQAFGHAPSFVDGHQHVHQLPQVRSVLLDILSQRYAATKPWLRSTVSPGIAWQTVRQGWRAVIKPWGIELLGAHALRRLANAQGFAQNQRLLGVYDFQGGQARYSTLLAQWLAAAQTGDALMCHPSSHTSRTDDLLAARQAELEVWRSAQVQELQEQHLIKLAAVSSFE